MKNEYILTYKLLKSWIWENRLKGIRLVLFILLIILGVIALGVGILFIMFADIYDGYLLLLLTFLCFYSAFFKDMIIAKRQYSRLSKTYGKENWTRTISFDEDGIAILEGTSSIKYSYGDIVNIEEKGNMIRLEMSNKGVIRLYKDAFKNGDWEGCKIFIENKRGTKNTYNE